MQQGMDNDDPQRQWEEGTDTKAQSQSSGPTYNNAFKEESDSKGTHATCNV
jgi:hypothetical protein